MYVRTGRDTAKIKIYHQNDWVWLTVTLRGQDVKYIEKHCKGSKEMVPTIAKIGKQWYLVFPFKQKTGLPDKAVWERVICSVDLGINNSAVCAAMLPDGTVIGRKFIEFPIEKDRLNKALGRQKKAQQGGGKTPVKWKHINDINTEISRKTAKAIIKFAIGVNADVIMFEYLDTSGKKHGSKKQRLHLWRKKEIQDIVKHNAHRNGIRISRVCAWGTSRLAYDGSGAVERDGKNYSLCVFKNGKKYHTDLNAAYNIGSRYFIREILKSGLATDRLPNEAKDPCYGTGTTRTLSTLIRLNADLCA
jgi:IS605 OrfB family transposase